MKLLPIGTKVVATGEYPAIDTVKVGDKGEVIRNDPNDKEFPNLVRWGDGWSYWSVPHKKLKTLKKGDTAVVTGNLEARDETGLCPHKFYEGTVVTLRHKYDCGWFCRDSTGQAWTVREEDLKRVKKTKAKKLKFKEGDTVRVTANKTGHGFEIGQVITIETVNTENYKALTEDGTDSWFVEDSEIKKIKKIKKAKKSQLLEVGDKVTFVKEGFNICEGDLPLGSEGIIQQVAAEDPEQPYRVRFESLGISYWFGPDNVKEVEEPKEQKVLLEGYTSFDTGYTKGAVVTVLKRDSDGTALIAPINSIGNYNGDEGWWLMTEDLGEVENKRKFEVGDRVVLVDAETSVWPVGTEGVVKEADSRSNRVENTDMECTLQWLSDQHLEKVPEPVDKQKVLRQLQDNTILGAVFAQHALWGYDHHLEEDYPEYFEELEKVLDGLAEKAAEDQDKLLK